jgi:O-antigen ligase
MLVTEADMIRLGGNIRIGENSGSGNSNTVSTCIGLSLLPVMYRAITCECHKEKVIYWFVVGLASFTILLTGSKKGILILIIAIVIYLQCGKKSFKKYAIFILIMLLGFYLIFFVDFFYNIIGYRLIDALAAVGVNVTAVTTSESTDVRMNLIARGMVSFWNVPFLGGGMNYFEYANYTPYYSHNNFVEVLNSFGVIGFMIYYSLHAWTIRRGIRGTRKLDPATKSSYIFVILYVLATLVLDFGMVSFSSLCIYYFPALIGSMYIYLMSRATSKNAEDDG